MLKKVLASVSALALALGMIALVAGPASAHTGDLSATAVCQTDGTYKVTYTLTISATSLPGSTKWSIGTTSFAHTPTSNSDLPGTVQPGTVASTGAGAYVLGTKTLPGSSTQAPWAYAFTTWTDGVTKGSDGGDISLAGNCGDDTSKKITLCHATGSNSNPYSITDDSVNAIINHSGHGAHPNDIIPPFTYTLHGTPGSYPGQNWTAVSQLYYNNDCNAVSVTPTKVTFTDAVCTAAGQYGAGSFTIASVPTGVQYQYSTTSNSGPWTNVGAGTTTIAAGVTVYVQAIALDGYKLTGTTSWSHTISHPTASKCVVPTAPTLTQSVCTTPGNSNPASYTIPASTTVKYQIKNGANWNDVSAGDHTVSTFPTTVVIRAVVIGTNIIVPGSTTEWTFVFSSPGDCKVTVTPTAATFHDAVCTGPGTSSDNTYTIPSKTGVHYQVKVGNGAWSDVAAGTYTVGAVTIHIQALPDTGYTLSGTTTWDHTFVSPGACLVSTSVSTVPSFVDGTCTAPGVLSDSSYTLTATTGVDYQVSTDNSTFTPASAGTHVVPAGTHIWITASAQTGYLLTGPSAWDHLFPATDCTVTAIPVDPSHADQTCVVGTDGKGSFVSGYIVIPSTTGAQYYIDGSPVSAGNIPEAPGDYTVTATALPGYILSGYPADGWPEHIKAANGCGNVTPVEPTVVDRVCGVNSDGNGDYTTGYIDIPSTVGVNYYIDGTLAAAGHHDLAPGDYTVTFAAIPDYTLAGDYPADGWVETIAGNPCGDVHPVEPNVVDQTCVVNIDTDHGTLVTGYIDIPNTTGVNYYIDGVLAAAGHHDLAPGDYTVTFAAIPDYTLAGDFPEGGWVETIGAAKLCGDLVTHPAVTPIVTQVQLGCSTDGSYTLSNDLADANAVFWTVDGSPVAQGTYQVTSAKTVHVHVAANGPDYGFNDPKQQTDWTLTFAAPTTCDLKTLALTGSTPVGGMLLAYFMLLAGIGIVAVRAVRRHGRPQE